MITMLQKSSCSSKYQVNPSLHLLFAGSLNHTGYALDRQNFLEFGLKATLQAADLVARYVFR